MSLTSVSLVVYFWSSEYEKPTPAGDSRYNMLAIWSHTVNQSAFRMTVTLTKSPNYLSDTMRCRCICRLTDLVPWVRVVLQRRSVILDLTRQVRSAGVPITSHWRRWMWLRWVLVTYQERSMFSQQSVQRAAAGAAVQPQYHWVRGRVILGLNEPVNNNTLK